MRETRKESQRARPGADQEFPGKAVGPSWVRVELCPSDVARQRSAGTVTSSGSVPVQKRA